jgi:phage terminase large subunit
LGANVNLNKELAVYAWRKDRDGHILEEPEDGYDHGVDALRYGLFTHLKYSGYGSGLTF